MSRIDPSVFRNWNDGDIMHESDYEQERQILYTAINDNYDRLLQKYDKTEVDALLNAMKGAGWTSAITIKGNYDLIQSIINAYATDAEVDAIRAALQAQIDAHTSAIADRYTKAETDAIKDDLDSRKADADNVYTKSEADIRLANKTDVLGDHRGTWLGLRPEDFNGGQQAINLQNHINSPAAHPAENILFSGGGLSATNARGAIVEVKGLADAAQTAANIAQTAANNAQSTANNALTTANGKAPSVHSHSSLSIVDTRPSGVKNPSAYSMGVYEEFVDGATYGLPAGNTYAQLRTIKPWSDFSKGPAHQIAFTSAGKIYTRTGYGTGWGEWKSMGGMTKAYRSRVNRSLGNHEITGWETVLNITGAGRLTLLRALRGSTYPALAQAKVFADGVDILDGLGYTEYYNGAERWYPTNEEQGLFVDSASKSGSYYYVALVPYVPFTSSLRVEMRYKSNNADTIVSTLMMYELFV